MCLYKRNKFGHAAGVGRDCRATCSCRLLGPGFFGSRHGVDRQQPEIRTYLHKSFTTHQQAASCSPQRAFKGIAGTQNTSFQSLCRSSLQSAFWMFARQLKHALMCFHHCQSTARARDISIGRICMACCYACQQRPAPQQQKDTQYNHGNPNQEQSLRKSRCGALLGRRSSKFGTSDHFMGVSVLGLSHCVFCVSLCQ